MRRTTCYLVMTVLLTGCADSITQVTGDVADPTGKPVPGAKVRLGQGDPQDRAVEATTDEKGQFRLLLGHAGFYDVPLKLTVTKAGYEPYTKTFKASGAKDVPSKIVLHPVPGQKQSE